MPFPLNATINRFGSQSTVTSGSGDVLSGDYSITGDISAFNHTTETIYLTVVLLLLLSSIIAACSGFHTSSLKRVSDQGTS